MPTEQIWLLWVLLPPRRENTCCFRNQNQNTKQQTYTNWTYKIAQNVSKSPRKNKDCVKKTLHLQGCEDTPPHPPVVFSTFRCAAGISQLFGRCLLFWKRYWLHQVAIKGCSKSFKWKAFRDRRCCLQRTCCFSRCKFRKKRGLTEHPRLSSLGNDPVFLVYLERGWNFAYTYIVIT